MRCVALLLCVFVGSYVAAQSGHNTDGIVLSRTEAGYPQGGAIGGRIIEAGSASYTVRLQSPEGKVEASVQSFTAEDGTFFILPLRFDIPAGDYEIRVIPEDSAGAQRNSVDVQVYNRDFPRQEIELTREVGDLRRTEDPRREKESEELWDILTTVSDDGFFHFDTLSVPLTQSYRVTSAFAHQRVFLYDDGTSAESIHWGWDLAAPTGTPVTAPGAGRIVLAQDRLITGYSIVLEHLPGVYSLFYHLDSLHIQQGDIVAEGDLLGEVGSTGVSTGAHLHWELRVAAVPVQPNHFLDSPLLDRDAVLSQNTGD